MGRLTSKDEFVRWAQRARAGAAAQGRTLALCCGTGCSAGGSQRVADALQAEADRRGLGDTLHIKRTGCQGFCERGPMVVLRPEGIFYNNVEPEDALEIIEKTVLGGAVIDRLLFVDPATKQKVQREQDISFYVKQKRVLLQHNGRIDPLSIEDYVAVGGYGAVVKALTEMTPEAVIDEVREAGLRGRGGAGFSTGTKWGFCRKAPGNEKYLICNADEGDPGAFMDRSILEGTPHAVLDGMIIAAYAIGASCGLIYVRAEYPIAVRNSRLALAQAREYGLLGANILGSGFDFDIEVREGAGAFVCGEETALIASLEGRRGMPRPRPPFPAQQGYRGKPTNINNVETFANVPHIIANGKAWYQAIGTATSKGTKIFALAGKVNNTGLVEVPMGTTLRQIVFEVGGGIPKNRRFKAAQMGGPSGGCVPARFLDLPIDYESVKKVGAIMGSGGLIVMDENTCMVDIARFFLEFVQSESCGKCVPCRVGTRHMLDILTRICAGDGKPGDIEELDTLAKVVKSGSLCGLGQTAPNPVLSTLQYFRDEYEEHIYQKRCRASACERLAESPCAHACPAGVNIPQYVGLVAENRLDDAVEVMRRRNPFLSVCGRVCYAPCERRCRRSDVDEPLAIRALKRYAIDHAKNASRTLVPRARGKQEVAIVGSGPAGLSCAYFLAVMGRPSVVFEALPIPGGMLAVGIPEYRLPKGPLQADIDWILSHGVELRTNAAVADIKSLRAQGYRAVFLGTGAHKSRPLRIPGEELPGVLDSLAFLRARALGESVACGKRVAVIGGGNAAVDTARSAVRLGAAQVFILYRRTRDEMPAYEEEVEAALEEGVELHELVAPVRILGNGSVSGIEMTRMRLGDADADGRRQPVTVQGSEFVVACDQVLPSVGQAVPDGLFRDTVDMTRWGTVAVDVYSGATSAPGVLAGGDCVSGGTSVIDAIADGQRAGVAIDRMLGGAGLLPPNVGTSLRTPTEEELEREVPRALESALPIEERRSCFAEVLRGLTPDAACLESGRCLRCDFERAKASACARKG